MNFGTCHLYLCRVTVLWCLITNEKIADNFISALLKFSLPQRNIYYEAFTHCLLQQNSDLIQIWVKMLLRFLIISLYNDLCKREGGEHLICVPWTWTWDTDTLPIYLKWKSACKPMQQTIVVRQITIYSIVKFQYVFIEQFQIINFYFFQKCIYFFYDHPVNV